jgi:hypothetical protein
LSTHNHPEEKQGDIISMHQRPGPYRQNRIEFHRAKENSLMVQEPETIMLPECLERPENTKCYLSQVIF